MCSNNALVPHLHPNLIKWKASQDFRDDIVRTERLNILLENCGLS